MNYIYALILINLIVWIPWLWRYRIQPARGRKNMMAILDKHPDSHTFKRTLSLLLMIYRQVNAAKISHRERRRLRLDDDAMIYGEIDFLSFLLILDRVQPQAGAIFYDLGCGAGKAVFSAALNYDIARAVGIELLPGLCEVANKQIDNAKAIIHLHYQEFGDIYLKQLSRIEIINADIQTCDLSAADIIFINATCFGQSLWAKIQEKLLLLKPGSSVIVTSKKITQDGFQLFKESLELMSWGMNSIYIYKKI